MATEAGFFVYDDFNLSAPEPIDPYGVGLTLSPEGIATATLPDFFAGTSTLRCFDLLGRTVGTFSATGPGTHRFPLRLTTGTYFLQLMYDGRIVGSTTVSFNR